MARTPEATLYEVLVCLTGVSSVGGLPAFSIFKRADVLLGKRDLATQTNQRSGGMEINQASACHGGSAHRDHISWRGTPGPGGLHGSAWCPT